MNEKAMSFRPPGASEGIPVPHYWPLQSKAINWCLAGRARCQCVSVLLAIPSAPAAARNETGQASVLNDKAKRVEKSQSLRARFRGAKRPPALRTKNEEYCLKRRLFRVLVRCLRRGTFLSPNKKVPKEVGLGGGVESLLPQSKPPSP